MADAVYSRDQVDDWQHKLELIAQKPRTTFTKRQVVEALFDTIEQALETRSYKEVADSLEDWGLAISEGSLKQYIARLRKSHKTGAASAGRKRSAQTQKSVASSAGAKAVDEKAAARSAGMERKATTEGASGKPKRFIEMPEDL